MISLAEEMRLRAMPNTALLEDFASFVLVTGAPADGNARLILTHHWLATPCGRELARRLGARLDLVLDPDPRWAPEDLAELVDRVRPDRWEIWIIFGIVLAVLGGILLLWYTGNLPPHR